MGEERGRFWAELETSPGLKSHRWNDYQGYPVCANLVTSGLTRLLFHDVRFHIPPYKIRSQFDFESPPHLLHYSMDRV